MGVKQVYVLQSANTPPQQLLSTCERAIQHLVPLQSCAWERLTRWYSQKAAWQEVVSTKNVTGLGHLGTVETEHYVVLVKTASSGKDMELLPCASDVTGMLQNMAYICSKEVAFLGTLHVFGDIHLMLGKMVKRSNDVQDAQCFFIVEHTGSDMILQATPMLSAFAKMFVQTVQREASEVPRVALILPSGLAALGECYTAEHEAMCMWKAATAVIGQ